MKKKKYMTRRRKREAMLNKAYTLLLTVAVCASFIGTGFKSLENDLRMINDKKINFAFAKQEEPEMKEWVLNEVAMAGLDVEEIDCLIKNESGWNNWAYNINTNGTTDMGLWMWNSIHKNNVSVECRFDYKCATKKAIEKILHDGNYGAWYGYRNGGCSRYAKK